MSIAMTLFTCDAPRAGSRVPGASSSKAGRHRSCRSTASLPLHACSPGFPLLTDQDGRALGMLGFFEAFDEPEHVTGMLQAAVRGSTSGMPLKSSGPRARLIRGTSTAPTWGLSSTPRILMEPYNRPYYPRLWESAGFRPLETFYSKRVDRVESAADELQPILDRQLRRGYRLRTIDLRRFEDELSVLHRLSTAIFAQNFLYEEISLADFSGNVLSLAILDPSRPGADCYVAAGC